MANPLEKIKKLKGRSLKEFRERGSQAFAAYGEQIGFGGKLPTDEEFRQLLDDAFFAGETIDGARLLTMFFERGENSFFQSFAEMEKTLEIFQVFGAESRAKVIEKAERIAAEDRFDLLGFENLSFETPVNWHFEPVAGKRLPLKHWKQFDELDASETGDKKIVWELNRHQHFFTLGLAYRLTGDERYSETFARHLEGWMAQNPPGLGINWFSSLEVGFRAISWLWAFHFFRNSQNLAPALFQDALKFLYVHGRHIEKYLSTYYSPNTHLTGEALALYYLGTQLPFFRRAREWRALGAKILLDELDRQILADGVYFEQTTWYARYTADFYTHFLVLKTLNGEKFDQESEKKLSAKIQLLLNYLMYLTRPDGTTPLVGDDDGGRLLPLSFNRAPDDFRATLATGAALFGRGDYKFVAVEAAEETLWLLGAAGLDRFEKLAETPPVHASRAFADGGYFVMRDGWDATDNYLLVDCGPVGALSGGHGHADALAIDLAVGGRSLLVDAGTYTYHESEELRDYFRSTAAHNALVIDNQSSSQPGGKFGWRTLAKTDARSWISEARFDFFEGSHDGYAHLANSPATHARSILFLKNDYWIVRDFVATAGAHEYQLNFHFAPETAPTIIENGDGKVYVDETTDEYAGLRMRAFGDNGGWRAEEGWISDCYGRRRKSPLVKFVSQGAGAQEFFTFLLPTDSFAVEKPEVIETELAGGRAFVVWFRGYTDVFVFADGEQMIRTEFFDADFRFVWARLNEDASAPEEFVMIDGRNFVVGGREIINRPEGLQFLTARRLGNKLNVRTNEGIFSVSLPQHRSHTLVLKNSL